MKKPLTMDELGEELCKYCDMPEERRGARCYGGEPVFCFESGYCEEAYQVYLDDYNEEE